MKDLENWVRIFIIKKTKDASLHFGSQFHVFVPSCEKIVSILANPPPSLRISAPLRDKIFTQIPPSPPSTSPLPLPSSLL
jgi:hypothetical protein